MRSSSMEILGFTVPLWAVFLGVILIAIITWKLIKFAIKLLVALLLFFGILMGLDLLGIFDWLQGLIATIL